MAQSEHVTNARRLLGEQLAELRRSSGLSQQQLADRIGYSRATIAGAERGTQSSSDDFWRRCSDFLETPELYGFYKQTNELREEQLRIEQQSAQRERDQRLVVWRQQQNQQPASSLTNDDAVELNDYEFDIDIPGSVDAVTKLWQKEVSRRDFLIGAFAAASYASPALRWLTQTNTASVNNARRVIGQPDVETIREMTATFRRIDNRFGGGHARMAIVRYLDSEVTPLIKESRHDEQVGKSLFASAAEMTQLVGWMAHDAGQDNVAQTYFIHALELAKEAGDDALGTEILAGMSQQCVFLGNAAEGIDLARAARHGAFKTGSPRLIAEAAVMEAHGHARLGDERASTRAMNDAESAFQTIDLRDDPEWMSYFDEAYMAAKFGHCFRDLKRNDQAEHFAKRSLQMSEGYERGRMFNTALLASVYAQQGEAEQAAALGQDAAHMASSMKSARTTKYLMDVSVRLEPYGSNKNVQSFQADLSSTTS